MINPSLRVGSFLAFIALSAASHAVAVPPLVENFAVTKGALYEQASNAAPALVTNPYIFQSSVYMNTGPAFTNATVRLPSGQVRTYNRDGTRFIYEKSVATKAALDREFAVGRYGLTIDSTEGRQTANLSLGADMYPSVPQILNFTDAQNIEATVPFTLEWAPFAGGTTNDYILVHITDATGEDNHFETPPIFHEEALNGTNTSVTIPANVLPNGTAIRGRLLFVKKTGINTNSISGAVGYTGYYRQTSFPLNTLSAPPAEGRYQFSASSYSVGEGGEALLTVTRAGGTGSGSVNYSMTGVSASDADFEGSSGTLDFGSGVTSRTISIPTANDYLLESNETVSVSLSSPSGGAVLGSRNPALLTILDNEVASAGMIQFKSINVSVSETSRVARVTVSRTGGSKGTVSASYATAPVSLTPDTEFTVTNGTLVFPSGIVSRVISVPLRDDTLDEADESLSVFLTGLTGGARIGSNVVATVTVRDNDIPGNVSLRSATFSAAENSGYAEITVLRASGKAGGITVNYQTQTGSAGANDFTMSSGTVRFEANETVKKFQVPINNDQLAEGAESFTVQLLNPQGGATLGANSQATVNIVDDEVSLSFSQSSYTTSESNRTVVVTVTRSGPLTSSASVSFATADAGATAGVDYRGTNGVLTFPSGVGSRTIAIPITADFNIEGDESFIVTLSNPQGSGQLGTVSSTTVTLVNDDFAGTISFSAATYTAVEGSPGSIIVRRTGGVGAGVSVGLMTTGVTATAGTDFTSVSTTVQFAGGETSKTISIPTTTDITLEGTETVNVLLFNPQGGATLGSPSTAVFSISNKPDANAVPADGESFFTFTATGQGFPLSKSMNIKNAPLRQETVAGSFNAGVGIQGVTGSKTIAGSGFPPSITMHTLQMPFLSLQAPGIVTIDGSSSAGGAIWTFITFGGESHTYGTGKAGASGSITIDVLDASKKVIAGRFDFIAVDDNNTGKKVRIKGSFRVKNAQFN